MIERWFGVEARDRIAAAVREAEARSEGQIVVAVVEKADDYPEARLRGALAAALLAAAGALAAERWHPVSPAELVLAACAAAALGWLAAAWDPLERLLARGARQDRAVRQRALRAFHEHDLHRTRRGTGVLVFASLFERRAVILGDHGIHAAMGEEAWTEALDLLTAGLARGDPGAGFEAAIAAVGARLAASFPRGADAPGNELPDAPRVSRD